MSISLIAAVGRNYIIGCHGRMSWTLPADLQYFKRVTWGHPVIMGRKTFASIGRALPGRENVILTRDEDFKAPGCIIMHSVQEVLDRWKDSSEEAFIIGGGDIYRQCMPVADKLYITWIEQPFEGDTFFPDVSEKVWECISCTMGQVDVENTIGHTFCIYNKQ